MMIITLAEWDENYAPPPVPVYLAYLFAGALLNFAADLSDEMIERFSHEPPIGCFFDYCEDKESIKLGMVGANLCGKCETRLFGMGLSDEALHAVERILLHVRDFTIRRPRKIPTRVFIGHGHSDAWKKLADFLVRELHLPIEEFNREPVAGYSTVERLRQMLDGSRLAFLVMTAEDLHKDDKKHARENVVHEIGLFQGKLGFDKAIIRQEEGVGEFSNIHGLNCERFPSGKPEAVFERVRALLVREGVIEAGAGRTVF
jgi:hypothetical protein